MPERRRTHPVTLLVLAGVIAGAVAGSAADTAADAATGRPAADADSTVGWTVETADNDNGVGRGNFTYDVEAGAVIADTMIVVNTGTQALPLAVYAADAFTTSSGEIDVLVDGTPSEGAGSWVTVDTPAVELMPGQRADIAFTIAVPADARPGDHAAGLVTSLTSTDPSATLAVDRRLGTRINLRVAGDLAPAASITGASAGYAPSWNPFSPGTLTVTYTLENSGNTRVIGTDAIAVTGPLGLFATDSEPAGVREIIPGSTVEITRELPVMSVGWLGGTVTVVPEGVGIGSGSASPVSVEIGTAALPWSLYALLVAIVAVVVGTMLAVRRARRGRDGADPDASADPVDAPHPAA
ncbi:hypothetical protein [Microbacterium sp. cf332]|uniref:hypothetical protein n=1 Tax=Microbacterium sp. cf332 TaxID=1761804 RepID=UPI000883E490|nr:hypothetical protein [Microbacterium sp. cf332]SDQ61428.1 hypothetical protein SAMN04487847_2082 [Microbacterium sp. cf332]